MASSSSNNRWAWLSSLLAKQHKNERGKKPKTFFYLLGLNQKQKRQRFIRFVCFSVSKRFFFAILPLFRFLLCMRDEPFSCFSNKLGPASDWAASDKPRSVEFHWNPCFSHFFFRSPFNWKLLCLAFWSARFQFAHPFLLFNMKKLLTEICSVRVACCCRFPTHRRSTAAFTRRGRSAIGIGNAQESVRAMANMNHCSSMIIHHRNSCATNRCTCATNKVSPTSPNTTFFQPQLANLYNRIPFSINSWFCAKKNPSFV